MDKTRTTLWEIVNHNITIGAVIVGVIFWVNSTDKVANDAIIKLQTNQNILIQDIDGIQNNHLAHIQETLTDLTVKIAVLIANQEKLLNQN